MRSASRISCDRRPTIARTHRRAAPRVPAPDTRSDCSAIFFGFVRSTFAAAGSSGSAPSSPNPPPHARRVSQPAARGRRKPVPDGKNNDNHLQNTGMPSAQTPPRSTPHPMRYASNDESGAAEERLARGVNQGMGWGLPPIAMTRPAYFGQPTSTCRRRSVEKLAEWTGLEPATPGVTGRYSNQLNYHSARFTWWVLRGSNSRPTPCKGAALPTELSTPATSLLAKPASLAHLSALCQRGTSGPSPP